jgi:lysophospholipase L1-like esterase
MPHARRFPSRLLLWAALSAPVLILAGCTAGRVRDSVELARASEPLQRSVAQPRARLLIVGDSTAVGTGASSPQASLGGLLAQTFADLHIDNRARDGATFADVARQLDDSARYDIVLIQAGGNDVIRLRDLDVVAGDIERVTRRARDLADVVLLMPAGNVGNAPFFFRPVSWLMTSRARRLHESVRETAARQGAVYVNLFKERADDPFAKRPELNARDGLHPSDLGYQVWFETLMAQSGLARRLASSTAHAPLAARDARCEHPSPPLSPDWST